MLNFGKLIIQSDGICYTNLNSKSIGNIYSDSVYKLIYNAVNEDDWFLVRNEVEPCNKCIFQSFCPPISNYERVLDMYNLCKIETN